MPLNSDQLQYQQDSARIFQQRYDDALRNVGFRAPQPILGQHPDQYRRETLRTLKRTFLNNHPLHKINMRGLPDDVLPQFEKQVLDAAISEATNPANVPLGELRKVERFDQLGRVAEINFIGQECFVKQMSRPGRRVVSFTSDKGRWNAANGSWF
jgi:hypothetical protein